MKSLTQQAIENIKARGFSHIKVELEAELMRDDESTCGYCDDEREVPCENCDGEGAVEVEEYVGRDYRSNWVECEDCSGEGYSPCHNCEDGMSSDFADEDDCREFILNNVSKKALDALTYGKFYNDGSVDSEFTFTVPIEQASAVVEYIGAFKKLGEAVGNGIDTAGAGMHIALLTQSSYGSRDPQITTNTGIRPRQLSHYKQQISRLLPALFLLGSANHASRELGFRLPRVSSSDKYSALYTRGDTVLEFRLFETCYDKPETFLEYVQVIGNTMQYFDTSNEVPRVGKEFFFNDNDDTCARFYKTADQLRILNHALKYVAPKNTSLKKLRAKRGVFYTVTSLSKEEKEQEREIALDYKRLVENHKRLMSRPITREEQVHIDNYIIHYGYTPEAALRAVRNTNKPDDFETFKSRAKRNFTRNLMPVAV